MVRAGIDILKDLARRRLSSLEAKNRLRSLRPITQAASAVMDLSHNDYLGLREDRSFQAEAWHAAEAWPMGAGASRLLGGEHSVYATLELAFSVWKKCETSLYFPSGYAANEALMTALAFPEVEFFSDSLNHASLIDGLRLARIEREQKQIFPHNDLEDLNERLARSTRRCKIVVTESLFSMDGDQAPLAELSQVCQMHGALLVVDEAHALGVYGPNGSGLIEAAGLDHAGILSINPCGKAMAASGAFVCGPDWLRQLLINTGRSFIYSTGASPWVAAGLGVALERVKAADDRRQHVSRLAAQLRHELPLLGFDIGASTTHIIPLVLGSEARSLHLEAELAKRGILARAIRPPTVAEEECRVRLSLHAGLTHLDPLLEALKDIS